MVPLGRCATTVKRRGASLASALRRAGPQDGNAGPDPSGSGFAQPRIRSWRSPSSPCDGSRRSLSSSRRSGPCGSPRCAWPPWRTAWPSCAWPWWPSAWPSVVPWSRSASHPSRPCGLCPWCRRPPAGGLLRARGRGRRRPLRSHRSGDGVVGDLGGTAANLRAVLRAAFDPVGEADRFRRPRMRAIRSWTAHAALRDTADRVTDPVHHARAGRRGQVPRGRVRRTGVGMARRHLFATSIAPPELRQRVAVELGPHLGEELLLLLLDVVAHVLHEDGHLGVEALLGRVHAVELGHTHLTMWCSSRLSSTTSSMSGTVARPGRTPAPRSRRASRGPRPPDRRSSASRRRRGHRPSRTA